MASSRSSLSSFKLDISDLHVSRTMHEIEYSIWSEEIQHTRVWLHKEYITVYILQDYILKLR